MDTRREVFGRYIRVPAFLGTTSSDVHSGNGVLPSPDAPFTEDYVDRIGVRVVSRGGLTAVWLVALFPDCWRISGAGVRIPSCNSIAWLEPIWGFLIWDVSLRVSGATVNSSMDRTSDVAVDAVRPGHSGDSCLCRY